MAQEAIKGKALSGRTPTRDIRSPQAKELVQNIDARGIEFLEQPFKENEWETMGELARFSPIPLGLDESIYGMEAVEKARRLQCARFVKFKIMKMGSGGGPGPRNRDRQKIWVESHLGQRGGG